MLGKQSENVPYPYYEEEEFEAAAVDALRGWDGVSFYKEDRAKQLELTVDSRDLTAMVTYTGFYQGWQDQPSNYLYSGTSIYEKGLYDADHQYNADKIDKNLGTYLVLRTLLE